MSKKPFDDAFKDLAEQDAAALLRLLDAIPPGATVTPLPREVSIQALLPDQPYEINLAGQRHIAHLEAQTYYESDLPHRVADYDVRLWLKYRLPVYTYVLVFIHTGMPKDAPTMINIDAGGISLTVRFRIIGLWQIPARRALGLKSESLLPLVPLMQGGEEELEQGARALGEIKDEIRRREVALHFVMVGSLRYRRDDLLDLMRRTNMTVPIELLRQSEMYQSILREGLEEGRQEGRQEGVAIGREALINLLRRMAARRFPDLTLGPEAEQIRDLEALEQICYELDQIPDALALRQRLAALADVRSATPEPSNNIDRAGDKGADNP